MKTQNIYVYLGGGLGNQLFQYALARMISVKSENHPNIFLDQERYKKYTLRKCEIQKMKLCPEVSFLPNGLSGWKKIRFQVAIFFHRALFKILPRHGAMKRFPDFIFQMMARHGFLLDLDNYYHPIPFQKLLKKKNVFMYGFFQSPRYFQEIMPLLRSEFLPKAELSERAVYYAKILSSSPSVCLSFRCSDYKQLGFYLGDIDPQYFRYINDHLNLNPSSVPSALFSEDPSMAKKEIPSSASFLPAYELSTLEQLFVMTQCTIYYLSNSTYSWWGAFLSSQPNKLIFGPSCWFNGTKLKDIGLYDPTIEIVG